MVNRMSDWKIGPPDCDCQEGLIRTQASTKLTSTPHHATQRRPNGPRRTPSLRRLLREHCEWALMEEHLSLGNYFQCTMNKSRDSSIMYGLASPQTNMQRWTTKSGYLWLRGGRSVRILLYSQIYFNLISGPRIFVELLYYTSRAVAVETYNYSGTWATGNWTRQFCVHQFGATHMKAYLVSLLWKVRVFCLLLFKVTPRWWIFAVLHSLWSLWRV